MTSTPNGASPAQQIVDAVGGPGNISALTHCATRLRFELNDASAVDQSVVDKIPGVMGSVPQSGDRFQIIIGGAVQSMFTDIQNLPSMTKGAAPGGGQSDADVKAAARSKARGKNAWLDAFFEYLSNSFRPLLGVLLGASLVIAFAAVLDAFGVVDFRAADKPAGWIFVDTIWRSVFYFLPLAVAYNASKALNIDPWVGFSVMAALMTPEFVRLSNPESVTSTVCVPNVIEGAAPMCTAQIFGIPMPLNDYSGAVFVPLIMVAVLALVYKGAQRIVPQNLHLVFVPFLSMVIMVPISAFLIGPLGIWIGTTLGQGLSWLNTAAPFVFALFIPMLYPFLVPLGLHWPLNAIMLANISTLGYDFIQGPMGTWNFACFGATAAVLVISLRERDTEMRQTSTGALAAGLLGGISEPSLYGIHLRFKRIYPRMLVGCFTGGAIIAVGSWILGTDGVRANTFAFTSLLTIPIFSPMMLYVIAIAGAFFVAFFLILTTDYRTAEEKAAFRAERDAREAAAQGGSVSSPAPVAAAASSGAATQAAAAPAAVAVLDAEPTTAILSPMNGEVISLDDCGDAVFASRALGQGVAVKPSDGAVLAPVSGTLTMVAGTGHAFGLKTDDGVEVLVHVGIDTVKLDGRGFDVRVAKGDRIAAGDLMAHADLGVITEAGYPTTTIVVVTNTKKLTAVEPKTGMTVAAGDEVVDITK
ncbi:MAG TPA: glucose PTS transporter subunit IIA [Arachnia sp.]|nr:glucose PTS transporter subunit IIA [Arachnia sp.]HMT84865.1 glucose PTS transporter subunit IIA [Arachnia sp.]